jgi:hypothetical protein
MLQNAVKAILALIVIAGFLASIGIWFFVPSDKISPAALSAIGQLTGMLGTGFGVVLGYYFGSSLSSGGKDDTISKMAERAVSGANGTLPQNPIPPVVETRRDV